MIETPALKAALDSFETGHREYEAAFRRVPAAAVSYRKPGDDYSLGGIAFHVAYVLEHYSNVLTTIESAGFAECRPHDPEGLEARAAARAGAATAPAELEAELARTAELQRRVAAQLTALGSAWTRKAPVFYGDAAEAFPTAASDVLEWLTGHYAEHIPHLAGLVADWEREAREPEPVAVVTRFNEAFGRGDVRAVMDLMTEDCVFENTSPSPDGERFEGAAAVGAYWEHFFSTTESPRFETEEMIALGDRVVVRWRFDWGSGGAGGHVRGVDVFRVQGGRVAEKLAYVKG